ncbi:MAG: pitrilysin family protein [Verrucomicrobiales bacterium]|nr:pitrilysin family protein [Verrucomicrobiales bacterium]
MSSIQRSHNLEFPEISARVWTLPNGLEIIVKEDHSAPVVSLQAWCRAGSMHEDDWLGAGMSHFLEHMLFKGTERRNASDVAKEVQASGGYINAYTSFDRTVYWIDCPSSGFDNCLDVLCDVVGNAQIPKEEFDKEQEVIRREFAMGDDSPGQVVSKMLFHNAYAVHPCRQPVIGHLDLFNQLSRDDLYQYYREKYSPDNMFFVIAGAVDAEDVKSQIEKHLGGMERRRRAVPVLADEPAQLGKREEVREFPTELSRSRISWQIPDQSHPDVSALDLLASILGSGRSSRLYQTVREEKQLAHGVSAYAYTPAFRGIFVLTVDSEPDKLEEAEAEARQVIEKLIQEGVTEEELIRVRNQTLSAQFSTLTDMRGQASDMGSNWHTARNLEFTRDYVEEIQKVTCEDIQRVAAKYLGNQNTTRVALVPVQEKEVEKASSRPKRSEDIRRVEMENGLTVLLLADKRVPFVQATAAFRGGRLAEKQDTCGITRLMGRLLTKDTEKRSSVQLSQEIESAGGGISASIGNNTFGTSVGALKTDLELVVDMLGQSIQNPLFLDEVVDKERQFQISSLKAESDQPFTIAMNRFKKEMFGSHPYGLPDKGTEASLTSFTPHQISEFREGLVTGNNGVIGIFGDLDLSEAEDMIHAEFGAIPAGTRQFFGSSGIELPASYGQIVEETHEKEQAILLIGYRTCDLKDQDNYPIGLIDEACSDMASRMFIRIREDLGLAYQVGCMRMLGIDPGFLAFYVATSPEKLDLVQDEMIDEIGKLAKNGLDTEEFERAKASWLGREVIHLQGARELAGVATVDELVGLGWDHYRGTPDRINQLTQKQISEVAEKYIRDENRLIVRLTT